MDVKLRLVVEDAVEEGGRTAKGRGPLVLLGGVQDAIVKPGDDIGLGDARKRTSFAVYKKFSMRDNA